MHGFGCFLRRVWRVIDHWTMGCFDFAALGPIFAQSVLWTSYLPVILKFWGALILSVSYSSSGAFWYHRLKISRSLDFLLNSHFQLCSLNIVDFGITTPMLESVITWHRWSGWDSTPMQRHWMHLRWISGWMVLWIMSSWRPAPSKIIHRSTSQRSDASTRILVEMRFSTLHGHSSKNWYFLPYSNCWSPHFWHWWAEHHQAAALGTSPRIFQKSSNYYSNFDSTTCVSCQILAAPVPWHFMFAICSSSTLLAFAFSFFWFEVYNFFKFKIYKI